MKIALITLMVVIAGALVAVGVSRRAPLASPEPIPTISVLQEGVGIGDRAPDFTLTDYDGKSVKLSDFRDLPSRQAGTPIFINFWASWCPFCVDELPIMAKVQQAHGTDYVTLAINRGEDLQTAKRYTNQLDVTSNMLFLLDSQDAQYRAFQLFAMPSSIFIDRDGIIRDKFFGPLREEDLNEKLQKIL